MGTGDLKQAGRLAYRESEPAAGGAGDPVLFVHGFPESSYMWREALGVAAAQGRRAIAPDLLGYGDSEPDPPATWDRHLEALTEFIEELGLTRVVLVVHDWGGLIGLRWACENPDRVAAMLISNSGFFPDGKWHGLAEVLQTPGEGEKLLADMTRESFGKLLGAVGSFSDEALDEYYKALGSAERRAGPLEMYRSGDFKRLEAYEGQLAALGVPTLILWGENDAFAPVAGAFRFQKEIPGAEVEVIGGAGHFIWSDEPARCSEHLANWLGRV